MPMNINWQKSELLAGILVAGSLYGTGQAAQPVDTTAETTAAVTMPDYAQLNHEGQAAIERHDYVAAEKYFQQARLAATAAGQQDFLQEMDARRAAMYINSNEPSRAIIVLSPYIKPGTGWKTLRQSACGKKNIHKPKNYTKPFFPVSLPKPSPMYSWATPIHWRAGDIRAKPLRHTGGHLISPPVTITSLPAMPPPLFLKGSWALPASFLIS